jgi:hypothetical protein
MIVPRRLGSLASSARRRKLLIALCGRSTATAEAPQPDPFPNKAPDRPTPHVRLTQLPPSNPLPSSPSSLA